MSSQVIDFHAHHPSKRGVWGRSPYDAGEYLALMDDVGIDASVIFTFDGLLACDSNTNEETAQFVSADRDRLIGFGTVDPRRPDAAREVERCLTDLGLSGLKFHPWLQGFSPHGPYMDGICEIAADAAVPILFHDGTPPYSTGLQIAVLARRHPGTTFVLGHAGLHDLWREAVQAVRICENILACICGSPAYAIRQIVDTCPTDRVLFGTDGGLGESIIQPYVEARVREIRALLNPEEQRRILQDNPARVLGRHLGERP